MLEQDQQNMYTSETQLTLSPRSIRISVGTFFFIQGMIFASWASRIPHIQEKLRLSDGELGGVLLALPVGLMVSLPLSGWLVSRFGSRLALILSSIIYVMILPFLGLTQTSWQLMGILFFFGLFGNLFNISVNTQAVGLESIYGRSIMASFHGLWSLAGFTAAAIGTFLISMAIEPFYHFCLMTLGGFVLILLTFKNILPQDEGQHDNQPLFARPDKTLLILGLIAFCCMICEGTMFDWSGVYFNKVVHAPKELTTLGYAAFMGTMAGGRFIGDWLATRYGTKRIIQLNGILIAFGLSISILFPSLIPATIGFLLVGMGVSTVVPLVYGLAGKSSTMKPGVALAAVSSISFMGFLIGPPMIGFISEAADLRISFAVVAVLGFCTTLLVRKVNIEKV